jgi:hypothetical protein
MLQLRSSSGQRRANHRRACARCTGRPELRGREGAQKKEPRTEAAARGAEHTVGVAAAQTHHMPYSEVYTKRLIGPRK